MFGTHTTCTPNCISQDLLKNLWRNNCRLNAFRPRRHMSCIQETLSSSYDMLLLCGHNYVTLQLCVCHGDWHDAYLPTVEPSVTSVSMLYNSAWTDVCNLQQHLEDTRCDKKCIAEEMSVRSESTDFDYWQWEKNRHYVLCTVSSDVTVSWRY